MPQALLRPAVLFFFSQPRRRNIRSAFLWQNHVRFIEIKLYAVQLIQEVL
jgi:hypothetical protein